MMSIDIPDAPKPAPQDITRLGGPDRAPGRLRIVRKPPPGAPPPPPDGPDDDGESRPVIFLGPDLHIVVDCAVRELASDPDLYQRDGVLMHVLYADSAEAERSCIPRGSPILRPMAAATLRLRLTRAARWVKEGKRSDIETHPPDQIVMGVLHQGQWPGIRPIIGIIETPSVRPDGTLIDAPGYDAVTGFLYTPNDREFSACSR